MSMKLKLNIENMGNIDNATITIKPLTIIAGENSTGKTFITKSLYTILDSVYRNYFFTEFVDALFRIEHNISNFYDTINPKTRDKKFYNLSTSIIDSIENFVLSELSESKLQEQKFIVNKHKNLFLDLEDLVAEYVSSSLKLKKFQKYKFDLEGISENLNHLLHITDNHTDIIIDNIANALEEGFKKNFQITNLNNLIQHGKSKKLKIQLDNLGNIEIGHNEAIQFDLASAGIEEVQNVENIVFFDSPVYIKIRKALQNCRQHRLFITKDDDKYLKAIQNI